MPSRRRSSRRDDPSLASAARTALTGVADRYQYEIETNLPPCPDPALDAPFELRGQVWEGRFDRRGQLTDHRVRTYSSRGQLDAQVAALREGNELLRGAG